MMLAEKLIERADLQKRIEQVKQRLIQNAKVQEGDDPAEDPQALLSELSRLSEDLIAAIQQINRTNALTSFPPYGSLADALAVRDVLKLKLTAMREFIQAAVITQGRYSKSEVRFQCTVSVADLQRNLDQQARALRELDTQIQSTNWLTPLPEESR
jgi:hypothetical protein